MPCGGIYPTEKNDYPCWQCGEKGCDLILIEWDSFLHSACVDAFLLTEEGKVVLGHGHAVWVIRDGKAFCLHEESAYGDLKRKSDR